MPTYEASSAFKRGYLRLTPARRQRFRTTLAQFVEDLQAMESGRTQWFRPGTVGKLHGSAGLYELRWARDGRATFSWGDETNTGLLHVVWHDCGGHEILL